MFPAYSAFTAEHDRYQIMEQIINELYSDYLTGNLERNNLEGLIYIHLVNNQEKTCLGHWNNNEYEDFISWFYPRLSNSIDSYKETGSSFEAFFNKCLFLSSKEYRVKTITKEVIEYTTWSARFEDMYACEESAVYLHKNTEEIITQFIKDIEGGKHSRRILALILKCYYYISEDYAEQIAPSIGISSKILIEMIKKMQKIRQKKDDCIYNLRERIYCQYYRCIVNEKKLSLQKEHTITYGKLINKIKKAWERLEKMRNRMKNIRTEATNSQVAEVIGISKGTVDSSLHQLKEKWEKMAKKALFN
jgi:hypothetical protein